ncbi:hypothetical protein AVEN_172359-1, partial [Araneus ventricosus]
MVAAHL